MIVQVGESVAVLDEPLLEPDAIVWTELAQRVLDGDPLVLAHATTVPTPKDAMAPHRWADSRRCPSSPRPEYG
jgi:hypothetical protein